MEFKKLYSEKELNDLSHWFKSNKDNLPASFRVNKSLNYPNLHLTAEIIPEQIAMLGKNSTYSGLIHQYFMLREKLLESGTI